MAKTEIVAGPFGPRKDIADAVEKTMAEYVRLNPEKQNADHLRMIRLSAENTEIINYLQKLHEKGKL